MDIERIALGENWWDIKVKLTVGAQRASEEFSAQYITDEGTPEEQLANIPNGVKLAMNRAMVLKSTVAWSYGDVNEKTFDEEVPAADYEIVLKRCNELYSSSPFPPIGEN